MDDLLRQHILQNKLNKNAKLMGQIMSVAEAERVLDEPPGEFKFTDTSVKQKDSVREQFKSFYKSMADETDKSRPAFIEINGRRIDADISVVCVLKVLLLVGVSKSHALSRACYNMFVSITSASGHTKEAMLQRLPKDSYWTKQLAKAIEESV
jgi:hypothetical protein